MTEIIQATKKELPKKPEETEEDYKDRISEEAFYKLKKIGKRTKEQEKEYKRCQDRVVAYYMSKKGGVSLTSADADLRPAVQRLYDKLSLKYGANTPVKSLLVDRLVCAWSMATSYERLFQLSKYKIDMSGEDAQVSYSYNDNLLKLMKESRRGVEIANDQIIRLSQALQNLSSPPINVKAKNAIVAQNMQINQKNDKHTES